MGRPLPVGLSQDVEHSHPEAGQQQAQHIGQDPLRLECTVLGPTGKDRREKPPNGSQLGQMPFSSWALKMPQVCQPQPPLPTPKSLKGWLRKQMLGKQVPSLQAAVALPSPVLGCSPEFKQQRFLQAQQGCSHGKEENGGAKEDVLRAVAAPEGKRSSREQEEAEAHEPLGEKKRQCWTMSWPCT